MPKKKQPIEPQTRPTALPEPLYGDNKGQWADPYRPLVTNKEAGFEMGENKMLNQFSFIFAKDPGDAVKERLKESGYRYQAGVKTWIVNATSVTREIAFRLAKEFAGEQQDLSR